MKIDNFCEGWLGREDPQLRRPHPKRTENVDESRRDESLCSTPV